jgi:preprotein translocase subunit SecE
MNAQTKDNSKINHIFDYVAALIIVAGIGLFYYLTINVWLKWGIVFASIIIAFATFYWISPTGLRLHTYARESWKELGKVVWPSRKEAVQFTWIIFLIVFVLALFLWLVDSSLSWLFYTIILGRGN